ncbi:MAG: rod shape-determining protein RodA [Nitrospiraceae bacterium]|nr:MAG: rod shape-determining protein RodA [Nitrospiraceae bacterium]
MIDRRLIRDFDWGLLAAAVMLSLIGVMTIYSSTRPLLDMQQESFYLKQLNWIILSLVCSSLVLAIDYRWFTRFAYIFYIIGIILLVFVLIAGRTGMGAKRWISLGFFSFQPSEFFKIFFIATLTRYLSGLDQDLNLGLRELLKITAGFFLLPSLLILKQPDLGTMLILLFVFTAMILTAGIKKKIVVTALVIGLAVSPLVGKIFWGGLKDYQKNRIIAFIDPQADPKGIGYHITQSKVSIGAGGFIGKGYLKGTQGPYRFLPENHTDFIFSIFAEEWGFLGSIVLFGFYLFIIWRGFDAARSARDPEGRMLALGVTYMFTFYFIINVGMTLGLLPVVGVPLPLMSYGGTALLSNFLALSVIENVRMRRFASYY